MKQRVLLVDDEPDTQKTYSDLLELEGFDVTIASSGEEALGKINGYRPDLILLDVLLPGRDGVEIARELSRRPDARKIPIIMITALNGLAPEPAPDSVPGVRRLIYKPCRPKTLLEGIVNVLRYGR